MALHSSSALSPHWGPFSQKPFVNEIGLFAPTKAGLDVSREVQIKRAPLSSNVLKPNFLYLQETI